MNQVVLVGGNVSLGPTSASELPQAKNVQHVRINNGTGAVHKPSRKQVLGVLRVVECSDDGDNWYEWSGGRLTVEDKSIYRTDYSNLFFWEDIVK